MPHMDFLIVFLLLLHPTTAAPSAPVDHDQINSSVPAGLVSTSATLSSVTAEPLPTTSITAPPLVHTSSIPASITSSAPHEIQHSIILTKVLSEFTPAIQTSPPVLQSTPLTASSNLNAPTQTAATSSSLYLEQLSSTLLYDPTGSFPLPLHIYSSPSVPIGNASIAPTIRYALIAALVGVPTLTMLGFIIACRWKRARERGYAGSKVIADETNFEPSSRERKSLRFSSFFGVGNVNGCPDRDWKKGRRQAYASSVHSSAGMAGVGAHRGETGKVVPPMIQYVNMSEVGMGLDVERKANFDNPFGTPPPVSTGFFIAPSRVSPHVPPTPPAIHEPIPPILLQPNSYGGRQTIQASWLNPNTKLNQTTTWPTNPHPYQPLGGALAKEINPSPPTHVRFQPNSPGLSAGFLSPNMNIHMTKCAPSRTNEYHNSTSESVRTSAVPSVYGGITSPPLVVTPHKNPVLPYRAPEPTPEQTPVLPYLCSPASSYEQRPSMAPVIVIEAASPILDSESEYGESDTGGDADQSLPEDDETELRCPNRTCARVRRTGLVGSPQGFLPPSSTVSSVSSYSLSGTETSPSSSASSILPHESSASSAIALSASSSDDSSVTVTAATTGSTQNQRGQPTIGSTNILSWLPRNFEELEREGVYEVTY